MTVSINSKEIQISKDSLSLSELLDLQCMSDKGIAVAVDNKVVPRARFDSFAITDGMKIIVIKAVCGG